MFDMGFYKNKKILVTGHTGFKGSWLCRVLANAGSDVTGYALEPAATPNLFSIAEINNSTNSIIGDIRDFENLKSVFEDVRPEIVFHLAAQPLVLEGYENPRETFETNVMGTVNLLECVKLCPSVKSVVNVTTDKVYQNKEWCWGYREDEPLDGYDPYSNSKSCSELVTHSYNNSFFDGKIAVSTARAGNVIGGGDFAKNRIIPDCIRAALKGEQIKIRNPYSIRPFQHVLEPICAYLMIAQKQYEDLSYAGCYNVGPNECDCISTGKLTELFCKCWGENVEWKSKTKENAPHESKFLKLDCSKIKSVFGWKPKWNIEKAIEMVCKFHKAMNDNGNIIDEMDSEIKEFLEG